MSLSQLFVLSPRGDVIIYKDFKGNVDKSSPDVMFRKVTMWDGDGNDAPPVFCVDGTHYVYVKSGSLFWGATTRENVSPSLVLELLNRLFWIVNDYVGHVSEESVRRNFMLVYELIDEILDYGFPQNSSTERLKDFVVMEPALVSKPKGRPSAAASGPSEVIKSVLSTRRTGAKEEIFVDIVEKLTAIFDASGHLKTSSIVGSLQVKSYLNGNPKIRLGLSDSIIIAQQGMGGEVPLSFGSDDAYGPVVLDTYSLHESVDQEGFEKDRVLELVPPEGHFSLLTYRSSRPFRPPFRIYPLVEDDAYSAEKVTLYLRVRAEYEAAKMASGVEIVVPFPPSVRGAHIETDTPDDDGNLFSVISSKSEFEQRAEWNGRDSKLTWFLRNVKGSKEHVLRVRLTIESGQAHMVKHEMGPIMVHFVLPGKPTMSGLDVKYMKIMKDAGRGQAPSRWFRAVALANAYQVRTE